LPTVSRRTRVAIGDTTVPGPWFPLKKAIEQERDQKALDTDISDAAAAATAA